MNREKFMILWRIITAIGITLGVLFLGAVAIALMAWSKGLLALLLVAGLVFYGAYQWLD